MRPADLIKKFTSLDTRAQVPLVATVVVVLASGAGLLWWANRPAYTQVAAGLNPADAGKITAALDKAGISNQLLNAGTAVAVPEASLAQARVALANAGVSTGSAQPGFELFDKSSLGATDFQQQVQYQRALEGQIANTIGQIQGITSAQVQLVLPREQLFADQGTPASASVLLDTGGVSLDPSAVQGIARLVQNAVQGLQAKDITITDQTGRLLWPTANGGGDGSLLAKQAAQVNYANQLSARLTALLAQTLGPGKAEVQVNADLNVDKINKEQLQYGPKPGLPLSYNRTKENLKGQKGVGDAAGTGANVPTYGQAAGAGPGSNYRNSSDQTQLGVDKTVTKTEVAPGAINKLQVALLLDRSVPPAQAQALKASISAAAGLDPTRGDTISVAQVSFAKNLPAKTAAGGLLAGGLGSIIKLALVALGILVFTVVVLRGLRRRDRQIISADPIWLREIEQPTEVMTTPKEPAAPELPEREKPYSQQQVELLSDREPQQLAEQIRVWMSNE